MPRQPVYFSKKYVLKPSRSVLLYSPQRRIQLPKTTFKSSPAYMDWGRMPTHEPTSPRAVLLSPLGHSGQGLLPSASPTIIAVMLFHHWGSAASVRLWSNLVQSLAGYGTGWALRSLLTQIILGLCPKHRHLPPSIRISPALRKGLAQGKCSSEV